MKVIALLPIKNEAWVLEHTLACLSSFCDIVLVNDQQSQDRSREIARRFPKVVWIDSPESQICEQARWRLWDVARQYDGTNLLWCTDADELVSPRLAGQFIQQAQLAAGTVVDCFYCHSWNGPTRYRTGLGQYTPYWKPVAIVDDRRVNYDRSRGLPLHEERVPVSAGSPRVRAEGVPVLHLQWLLPNRSQMRQAWYRCREWMHGGRSAAAINEFYSITLPSLVQTAPFRRRGWKASRCRARPSTPNRHGNRQRSSMVRRARRRVLRASGDLQVPALKRNSGGGPAGARNRIARICRPGRLRSASRQTRVQCRQTADRHVRSGHQTPTHAAPVF